MGHLLVFLRPNRAKRFFLLGTVKDISSPLSVSVGEGRWLSQTCSSLSVGN